MGPMKRKFRSLAIAVLGLSLAIARFASAGAADLTLKVVEKEPPGEISEPIRKILQPRAVQLLKGDEPVYEFWFDAHIPLQSKPASVNKDLGAIRETTLLGVVAVHGGQFDYRDDELTEGVYTMRLGIIPEDGNHLGVSDYPYFALLIPAERDTEVEGIADHDALSDASGKDTVTEHPIIMSLLPVSSDAGELPRLNEPAPDHKSLRVKTPAKLSEGGEEIAIVFEVVYEGIAEF